MRLVSCKNDDGNPSEPPIENTTENISLVETAWQCVGFFDVEKNELTEMEYYHSHGNEYISFSYLLFFKTDTSFPGFSYRSDFSYGKYKVNYSTNDITIISFGMTYIMDSPQGSLYVKNFKEVQSFSATEYELKLFYNDGNNYLLYKSSDIELPGWRMPWD